jgi:predicted esterase
MNKITLLFCLLLPALGFTAERQSWKQVATQAIMAGDYVKAAQYYEKWVEADPTDAVSLYNLACCYAALEKPDSAMRMLTSAVAVGWSDSAHTAEDPDLKPLHGRADFTKALDQAARNARLKQSAYASQVCEQERLGKYVVILPEEYDPREKYPLIILLHNYGGTPEDFSKNVALINSHDYLYAIPEGSYPAADSDGKGFSHLREFASFQEDTASVRSAVDWVVRVADDMMKRYPVDGRKFYVVGFSQGAALAHLTAAYYPERVAGYCAHGGYLIKGAFTKQQLKNEKKSDVCALITHGKEDNVVRMEEGIYATNLLKQAGINVTFAATEGAHVFSQEVAEKVNEWLKGQRK